MHCPAPIDIAAQEQAAKAVGDNIHFAAARTSGGQLKCFGKPVCVHCRRVGSCVAGVIIGEQVNRWLDAQRRTGNPAGGYDAAIAVGAYERIVELRPGIDLGLVGRSKAPIKT